MPIRLLAVSVALAASVVVAMPVHADEPPAAVVPVPAPIGSPAAKRDLPLRFRDMLAFEAERARPERLFNGVIGAVSSTGLIAAGAISLATADSTDTNASVVRSYGWIMLSIGSTAFLASIIGMIPRSSAESLLIEYEPVAKDTRYDPEWRVRRGEDMLRAQARKDANMRLVFGIANILAGIGVAGISVWRATWTGITPEDRAISGTLTGASAILAIGQGVGRIWFQRSSAEVALVHWEATQGWLRGLTEAPPEPPKVSFAPLVAPTQGGVVAGVAMEF